MAEKLAGDSVYVRPARLTDMEAVLGIDPGMYQGCDYMSSLYTELLHVSRYHPYVVVVDGIVRVFKCFYVLDEGRTVFQFGSRTSEELQGRGLLQEVTTWAKPELDARYPHIERLMWSGLGSSRQDKFRQKYKGLYEECLIGTIYMHKWQADKIDNWSAHEGTPRDSVSSVALSTGQALSNINGFLRLFSRLKLSYLCDSIYLMSDVNDDNVKRLLRIYNVIATFDDRHEVTACSFHTTSSTGEDGLFSVLTFYGDVERSFADHFGRYAVSLKRITASRKVQVVAYLSFATELSDEERMAVIDCTGPSIEVNDGRTDISVISIPWGYP